MFFKRKFVTVLVHSVCYNIILFLLIKLVFLVFEIIRIKTFADDKKNHIERDESGRKVRAVGEEVFFTVEEDNPADNPKVEFDDDVYFTNTDNETGNSAPAADDDFFFG